MVNVNPTPIASISGTIAALLPAPKRYWIMYFPDMTSDFIRGYTSITHQLAYMTSHHIPEEQGECGEYGEIPAV